MNTAINNRMKRKCNGNDMPTIRERIDEDTGRVITVQIETTKEAKKRRKTNTAQWKPTAGQINAADIWNKQEEKIKRDKEREERRKVTAARQAEKDAKAKEVQDELLRKGKISVEDTWGKVSLSQNRLSKFFRAPRASKQPAKYASGEGIKEKAVPEIGGDTTTIDQQQDNCETVVNTIPTIITGSPPTKKDQYQTRNGQFDTSISDEKRKHLMLPPPAPLQRPPHQSQNMKLLSVARQVLPTSRAASPAAEPDPMARKPLSQMSTSQVNIRSNKQAVLALDQFKRSPQTDTEALPLSTQVVLETLNGISSQDLMDDFEDDLAEAKENSPSVSAPKSVPQLTSTMSGAEDDSPNGVWINATTESSGDEFDDDDIDDETLMYFAATQRVKSDFQQSVKKATPPVSPKLTRSLSREAQANLSSERLIKSPVASAKRPSAGDSFAFTDVDDEDLVRCVEEFEDDIDDLEDEDLLTFMENFEAENGLKEQGRPRKKPRVLPWVKDPVQFSSQETAAIPCSATQSFQEW